MSLHRFHALAIALFILGQGFAVAHAVEVGDVDHFHDCALCAATSLEDEHDDYAPPSILDLPDVQSEAQSQATVAAPATVVFKREAWPPQTGPPACK